MNVSVSVIIPVYNKAAYLDGIINQLRIQTFSNLQLIFVNDGSTDNSLEIIQKERSRDSRIEIINKDNGGLVDAELAGISAVRNEYTAFVDPDDKVGRRYIENFVNELDNDYDFIAQGIYFSANNVIEKVLLDDSVLLTKNDIDKARCDFLLQNDSSLPSRKLFHGRWNKLYKTSTLKRAAADFSKCRDITLGEDTIFTYLFLRYAQSGKILRQCNEYFYIQDNEDSMLHSSNVIRYIDCSKQAFDRLLNLMEEDSKSSDLPFSLFYMLTQGLLNGLARSGNEQAFKAAFRYLSTTELFSETLRRMKHAERNHKRRLALSLELLIKSPKIMWSIFSLYLGMK